MTLFDIQVNGQF